MKKKVYCRDCKQDRDWCYCDVGFATIDLVERFLGKEEHYKILGKDLFSRQLNKDNDCPYYKPKNNWKFWR